MANGKHLTKNKNSRKGFIAILLIAIILIIAIVFWYLKNFTSLFPTPSNSENVLDTGQISNIVQETELVPDNSALFAKTIENLKYLEISNFDIDFSNKDQTKVSILLNNKSDDNIKDCYFNISLLDSSGLEIICCDVFIDEILANDDKEIKIYTKQDITQVTDLIINKK